MFAKKIKIHVINQNNENDYPSPDLNNQNPNFIFNFPNQLNSIENNNLSFNNNFLLSTSLLNDNKSINSEIEYDNKDYLFKPNNIKNEKELDNLNNTFIFKAIINEKELDNQNNQIKTKISDGKTYFLDLSSLNKNNNNQELFFTDNTSIKNVNSEHHQKTKKDLKPHKKPTGRIKKGEKKEGKHNKYQEDNIRRKVKHLVLKNLMIFINKKIKILYNGNIGNNILKKEFLLFNKNPSYNSSIEYNKLFLKKTLKEILSENISTLYSNFEPDFNKKLVERLLNEKDKEKSIYFNKLFNLTFIDCLQHFNGTKNIRELDGMESIDNALEEFNNEKKYKEKLYYNIKNYDNIINKKKSRNSK